MKQLSTAIFIVVVSCSVLLLMCRYVIAHVWRRSLSLSLAEHCSNVDTVQPSLDFSNGSNIIQPIGKMAIPIDTSLALADMLWRSTAELTTNQKKR